MEEEIEVTKSGGTRQGKGSFAFFSHQKPETGQSVDSCGSISMGGMQATYMVAEATKILIIFLTS